VAAGRLAFGLDPRVVTGTPEDVAKVPGSYTGQYITQLLDKRGGGAARDKRPAQTEAAE
jgi:hypothetical protein